MAILSSALSKVGALGLQTIAIPLVYHALGQHQYALFLLVTGALATISLMQMGAGPGLTRGIAKANVAGGREEEASLFSAALRLSLLGAVTGSGALLVIVYTVQPAHLFGEAFGGDRPEILVAMKVCAAVLAATIVLGVADSALAGYQEQVITNLFSFCGNIASAVLLVIVSSHHPSIMRVILILYGLMACSRIASLGHLIVRRPYLLDKLFHHPVPGSYTVLLHVGFAFWLMQAAGTIELLGGIYVMAHFSTPADTDIFAVVFRVISLAGGAVAIFTQPLWPAITDAIARRNVDWIGRQYRRIRLTLVIYSAAVALAMATVGPLFFHSILHIETGKSSWLFVVLGIYFLCNTWTHVTYITMIGMSAIWRVVFVAWGENVIMVIISIALVPRLGATGMALGYLFASVLLPVWLLPRLFKTELLRETTANRPTAVTV